MGFTFQAFGTWDQFGFGISLSRMKNHNIGRMGVALILVFAFFEIRFIVDLWDAE